MSRRLLGLTMLLALTGCGAAPAADVSPVVASAAPAHLLSAVPTVLTAEPCRVVDARADARCTPGVLNPNVTQDTIHATICAPGWTDTVRPPTEYTAALKLQQMRDFAEPGSPLSYKEDHLVPLSIGGAPSDPHNLFPQPAAK
ncbi:MAG: hypothetical protein ACRDQ6_18470, partial [Pseudonocardiaceae bacterium]